MWRFIICFCVATTGATVSDTKPSLQCVSIENTGKAYGLKFETTSRNLILSPSTVDLPDISKSSGKGVTAKVTEVKIIVAVQTAPLLSFWFTVEEIVPQRPYLSLHLSHMSPQDAPLSQVAPSSKNIGDFWLSWLFRNTSNLVINCLWTTDLFRFCGKKHRTGTFKMS